MFNTVHNYNDDKKQNDCKHIVPNSLLNLSEEKQEYTRITVHVHVFKLISNSTNQHNRNNRVSLRCWWNFKVPRNTRVHIPETFPHDKRSDTFVSVPYTYINQTRSPPAQSPPLKITTLWKLNRSVESGARARTGSSNFLGCHVRVLASFANITGHRTPISQLNVPISILCIQTEDPRVRSRPNSPRVWVSHSHRDSRFARLHPPLGTILLSRRRVIGLFVRFHSILRWYVRVTRWQH